MPLVFLYKMPLIFEALHYESVWLQGDDASREQGDMAVVSIASDKGGVSKTSTAILIGAELALDGYRVSILDCDINQQAAAFGSKADINRLTVVRGR